MSNFVFLDGSLFNSTKQHATMAEKYGRSDSIACAMYLRKSLEDAVKWMYQNDDDLTPLGQLKWQNNGRHLKLDDLLSRSEFKELFNTEMYNALFQIKKLGNRAVHSSSHNPVTSKDAETGLVMLFDFCKWLANAYQDEKVDFHLTFNKNIKDEKEALTGREINKLRKQVKELDEKLEKSGTSRLKLEEELEKLKAQRIAFKEERERAEKKLPLKATNWLEKETRVNLIDVLLREAGWDTSDPEISNVEATDLPKSAFPSGKGKADYVLWGDDGLPVAVIEAKRTLHDPEKGRHQAKLYADGLQKMYNQRPVIFYSNGFTTWLWDDEFYPPREVMGFYSRPELQTMVSRRGMRRFPWEEKVDKTIVERDYQLKAISSVEERFCSKEKLKGAHRRALVVMATGAGKTRTATALVDVLMRANWVKRILFLADRNGLVSQAKKDFGRHLPQVTAIDLTKEKEDQNTRLVFSTYPTIINRIDREEKMYGIGHFDLIIIDEAHRSIYQRYRAIFDYFDAMILGLTATPKDEVDRDTFEFFNCSPGDPTFKYDLNEAVEQGYLVPPVAKQIDVGFIRRGIRYDDLSEEEKCIYEETFEAEYGYIPSEIPASEINDRLFNKDTIAKVLAYAMENGVKVKDRIGKTIIFARNIKHAQEIVKVFYQEYPQYGGEFCQAIFNSDKSEDLIDQFKIPDNNFRIAVSVDMLDTGIDVPEIVNLVFFKPVFSKSKFWQMVGRGTRLRQDLFGSGEHKEYFKIFDFCRNIDFFSINEEGAKTYKVESLSTRLFKSWIRLAEKLKEDQYLLDEELQSYRGRLLALAHYQILEMLEMKHSVNVRKRLEYLFNYEKREAWDVLSPADVSEIFEHIAPIVELDEDDYDAKVFDQFIHQMQLELLKENPEIDLYQRRLSATARALKKIGSVAVVRAKMPLINKLMDPKYVSQLNVTDLELVRLDIRGLVRLIETKRKRLYNTNFTDVIEADEDADMGLNTYNFANYTRRLNELLEKHKDHLIIHKIHTNEPITTSELEKLEELLLSDMDDEAKRKFKENLNHEQPLGVLIRNLIGLDENAAKKAFADISRNGALTEPQKQFINQIIHHLTKKGIVDPDMLYISPYKDLNDQGLDGVFDDEDATKIISILERIRSNVVG